MRPKMFLGSLTMFRSVTFIACVLSLTLTFSEEGRSLPKIILVSNETLAMADHAVHKSEKGEENLLKDQLVIRNRNATRDSENYISNNRKGTLIGLVDDSSETKMFRIVAFPYVENKTEGCTLKQLIVDGIERSPFLTMSMNVFDFDPSTVWVVDRESFQSFARGRDWCGYFAERVQAAQKKRQNQGFPLNWPIYVVNGADRSKLSLCPKIESLVGPGKVMYSQRSIAEHRAYDSSTNWTSVGRRMNLLLGNGSTVRHIPINVRTDIVRAIEEELCYETRKTSSFSSALAEPIEAMDRTTDVGYFWKPDRRPDSRFRDSVYEILFTLAKEKPWKFKIGFEGQSKKIGRHNAERKYVRAMLDCKIIVVAQRDKWEDHYRLFEGMAAGSLVFTDRMLSLPEGLEDGVSVIEFDSPSDLRKKLEYYVNHEHERLAIARRGREIAMSQHRSWHRMEEIIFGKALTVCAGSTEKICPFIVYPNETFEA